LEATMASRTGARSAAAARQQVVGSRYLGQAVIHLVLVVFSLAAVLPFLWMVFGSFKEYKELTSSMALFPQTWTLDNYDQIIGRVNFLNAFRNRVIIAVIQTFSVLLTSSAAGFVFAKYRFPGKEFLFTMILATMMIPFAVVLIPLYIFMSDIGAMDQLTGIIVSAVGKRPGGPHPARRTFQALRIAVNREIEELAASLPRAVELLAPGGRVVVLSYHSLEDRIVKRFFQAERRGCVCPPEVPVCVCGRNPRLRLVTSPSLTPSAAEIAANPRARSARLRAAERLAA